MGIEIERKYLVTNDAWLADVATSFEVRQGYLSSGSGTTVRVRVKAGSGYLTIKGAGSHGVRPEFEWPIPLADAEALLDQLVRGIVIEKIRYEVPFGGFTWEVDVFAGANAGLVLAEVELSSPLDEPPLPQWVGAEVTEDVRYYNASLAVRPFTTW